MTYHDAEVLTALLEALGHRCHVDRYVGRGWVVSLACGCDRTDARGGRCPG